MATMNIQFIATLVAALGVSVFLIRLNSAMHKGFANQDARFEARFALIDERFARIDARFDALDEKFARIDVRLDALDAKIDRLGVRLDARIDALDLKLDSRISTL